MDIMSTFMADLSQTLRDVPLAGLIPVALLVVVGLLLWAAGQRVLRAGFGAAGLLIGAFFGWLLGEMFNLGVPSWIAALFLGIVLACVAALTYRLAVAGALALVFGVGAPLAVITVHEIQSGETISAPVEEVSDDVVADDPEPDEMPETITTRDELDEWLEREGERVLTEELRKRLPVQLQQELKAEFGEDAFASGITIPEELEEQLQHLRGLAERLLAGFRESWDRAPEGLRPYLLAAMVLGGLLGILIGTLVPKISASIITAFSGSLLWLAGVQVMSLSLGLREGGVLPQSGRGWLTTWIIVAIIGLVLQWIFFRKRADKSS